MRSPTAARESVSAAAAAAVAAAFGTELHYFQAGAQTRIANTSDPQIPSAFAGAVQAVGGLSAITFTPAHRIGPPQSSMSPKGSPQPASTYCPPGLDCQYNVFPADFATIYNLEPVQQQGIDGSGQTIGIIARARVYDADVNNFQARAGLARKLPVTVIPTSGVDPGPAATTCSESGTPSCSHPSEAVADQTEATLDVQRATSVAPGATIKLITSGTKDSVDGVYIAMDYAIDNDPVPAKILSISYSSCEADNSRAIAGAIDDFFSQAAMEGISVFVASGDGGVAGCASLDSPPPAAQRTSTNLLCASGYVTCVGGTEFADADIPSVLVPTTKAGLRFRDRLHPRRRVERAAEPQRQHRNSRRPAAASARSSPQPSGRPGVGVPGNAGRYTPDVSLHAATREGYFTCVAAQGGSCAVVAGQVHFHHLGRHVGLGTEHGRHRRAAEPEDRIGAGAISIRACTRSRRTPPTACSTT